MNALAGWWGQVWPNLAASVLWAVPGLLWHHRALKRHVDKSLAEQDTRLRGDS